jgi:hypothetical protein
MKYANETALDGMTYIPSSINTPLRGCNRLCGLVVRGPGYRSRGPGVRCPALPDFLRSSGSETESTPPLDDN